MSAFRPTPPPSQQKAALSWTPSPPTDAGVVYERSILTRRTYHKGEFLKEPLQGVPFGLSALFHFMLLVKFCSVFPRNPSHLLCGGWWVVGGAYFGVFSKRRIILLEVGRILIYSKSQFSSGFEPWTYSYQDNGSANYTNVANFLFNIIITNFFKMSKKNDLAT